MQSDEAYRLKEGLKKVTAFVRSNPRIAASAQELKQRAEAMLARESQIAAERTDAEERIRALEQAERAAMITRGKDASELPRLAAELNPLRTQLLTLAREKGELLKAMRLDAMMLEDLARRSMVTIG